MYGEVPVIIILQRDPLAHCSGKTQVNGHHRRGTGNHGDNVQPRQRRNQDRGGTETKPGAGFGLDEDAKARDKTYSSRMKLPTEIPPQLIPPIILPARLSRRARFACSRFGFAMEMGFAPALTNESWRLRPVAEPKSGPVVILASSMSIPISARNPAPVAVALSAAWRAKMGESCDSSSLSAMAGDQRGARC